MFNLGRLALLVFGLNFFSISELVLGISYTPLHVFPNAGNFLRDVPIRTDDNRYYGIAPDFSNSLSPKGYFYSIDTNANYKVLKKLEDLPTLQPVYLESLKLVMFSYYSNNFQQEVVVSYNITDGSMAQCNATKIAEETVINAYPAEGAMLITTSLGYKSDTDFPIYFLYPDCEVEHIYTYQNGSFQYQDYPLKLIYSDQFKNIFGISRHGGDAGSGSIFLISGGNFELVYSFSGYDGAEPLDIILQNSKALYGICFQGGNASVFKGTIFELDIASRQFTGIFSCSASDCNLPTYLASNNESYLLGIPAGGYIIFIFDLQSNTIIGTINLSEYTKSSMTEISSITPMLSNILLTANGTALYLLDTN